MATPKAFNVRVYGLLINKQDELLVIDEYIEGKLYTKFPGGGLEFGEGIEDCLIREFIEETGNTVKVKELFYINKELVPSIFKNKSQLICIYYFVKAKGKFEIKEKPNEFEFEDYAETIDGFRWIPLENLKLKMFELPTDKMVVKQLIKLVSKRK